MEAARAAITKITSRTGHRTDVDEVVNPAVTSETIKPHRHEETTEAIDREVHQDHYHTTVQPIQHREVLPEKHTHNLIPQVQKEFRHDNEEETRRTVSTELARFQNTSVTAPTTTSHQHAPAVAGEHVHHHVHETVQPIIHKETIQPEVIHTTIPIHEVHHAKSTHHGMSALPMKTLDEFKTAGGLLTGSKSHTHEEYDGAPRPYNEKLTTTIEKVLPGHHHSSTTGTTGTGLTGTQGTTGSGLTGTHGTHGTTGGLTGNNYDNTRGGTLAGTDVRHGERGYDNTRDSGVGGLSTSTNTTTNTTTTSTTHKPSLMDKLNPKVDADGDGKAGFMK